MEEKMEERIHGLFESIGLNKNEVKIYIDLLKNKKSSVLDVAKRTKIHRSNIYDALRKLIEIGFIIEVIEEKKKLFRVLEPEKILEYLRQKELEVKTITPYLKQLTSEDDGQVEEEIAISKGIFAVREVLKDLLKIGKTINVYGASQESLDVFGLGFLKEFHNERIKKGILMRHIYSQDAKKRVNELNKMKVTEAKYFSKKYFSIASTNVCGDTVTLIIFSKNPHAITIKNPIIAESYNRYFEILWQQGRV
jgi:sugar-specific transcriptional regulator TrmB